MSSEVREAYSRRAVEYTELHGSMAAAHPLDRRLVSLWAAQITGPAVDAGCGPGQWTKYLAEQGVDARGIDLVPAFISYARETYPGIRFDVGEVEELDVEDATLGGILAWYSLIHHEPRSVQTPLEEFARALCPGSDLLLGFFEGPTVERFEHGVTPAYRWPIGELSDRLREAHFDVIETHTRPGPAHRPHGALLARRSESL